VLWWTEASVRPATDGEYSSSQPGGQVRKRLSAEPLDCMGGSHRSPEPETALKPV
jgi:hypothetical protein